ncbi:MAG: GDP-mannose 4,6-dehydratase [Nanoarchaeota archaeon]
MKVIITGSSGFVGPWLRRAFSEHDVVGIDRHDAEHVADILDFGEMKAVFSQEKPEWVVHLAAQSSVARSWEHPEETMNVNVEGTRNVLDAAGDAKVLVIGSAEVYGIPQILPITEDHTLTPISPYGQSRKAQEKLVQEYIHRGKNIVISRSFSHTGPGQLPQFVCSEFAKAIAEIENGDREEIIKTGDGSIKRDFTDVRDIVVAYRLALEKARPGVYNICSGRSYSIRDILDRLLEHSSADVKIVEDETKIRKADIPDLCGDAGKFNKETGWKPEIRFSQTLKDLLEYWRQHLS